MKKMVLKKVPALKHRINTFKELNKRVGNDRVIWRFDPLIVTNDLPLNQLLERVERIGDELCRYTNKLVFSFADITSYRKVALNLKTIPYIDFTYDMMIEAANKIGDMAKNWGIKATTCSEKIDLEKFGIEHNKCIDDDLMVRNFRDDKKLMEFLGVKSADATLFDDEKIVSTAKKDKGQREDCGCIMSKDIGAYNTCPHECLYCYANSSKELAQNNWEKHKRNKLAESILGD